MVGSNLCGVLFLNVSRHPNKCHCRQVPEKGMQQDGRTVTKPQETEEDSEQAAPLTFTPRSKSNNSYLLHVRISARPNSHIQKGSFLLLALLYSSMLTVFQISSPSSIETLMCFVGRQACLLHRRIKFMCKKISRSPSRCKHAGRVESACCVLKKCYSTTTQSKDTGEAESRLVVCLMSSNAVHTGILLATTSSAAKE